MSHSSRLVSSLSKSRRTPWFKKKIRLPETCRLTSMHFHRLIPHITGLRARYPYCLSIPITRGRKGRRTGDRKIQGRGAGNNPPAPALRAATIRAEALLHGRPVTAFVRALSNAQGTASSRVSRVSSSLLKATQQDDKRGAKEEEGRGRTPRAILRALTAPAVICHTATAIQSLHSDVAPMLS